MKKRADRNLPDGRDTHNIDIATTRISDNLENKSRLVCRSSEYLRRTSRSVLIVNTTRIIALHGLLTSTRYRWCLASLILIPWTHPVTQYEAYDLGISPLTIPERIKLLQAELATHNQEQGGDAQTAQHIIQDPENPEEDIVIIMDVRPAASIEIQELEELQESIRAANLASGVDGGDKSGKTIGSGRNNGPVAARSKTKSKAGSDIILTKEEVQKHTLAIRSNAQAKYLVQRWEAGTVCDMTGRGRVVEVEFRCGGPERGDEIIGIKETST